MNQLSNAPKRTISKTLCIILFLITTVALHAQSLSDLKNTKPFTVNGSLGLNTSFYNASGIPDRQTPFALGVNANATLTVYGISMPFSFTWYSNEKAGFRQPFNQFGISPTYRWLTLHLGYRNVSFSEFTLNGHTFLGAGLEARPGKFRLAAVYGKFNETSQYDLLMADSIPKLTRLGWAGKIGYGTEKTFVDISMLRIGDNKKNFIPSDDPEFPVPAQNMALGLTSRISLTSKLILNVDGSLSFLTSNSSLGTSDTINDRLMMLASNLISINPTSQRFSAIKTSLTYNFSKNVSSGFEYRRIDPGFQSMGSYFFNNDLELITFNQSVSLLESKFRARGSIGMQRDNLDGSKNSTSRRMIGSLSGNYAIDDNWAVDLSYNNYSTNQKAVKNIVDNSLMVFQVNHSLLLSPRFMKASQSFAHLVMLNLNWMILNDKNSQTSDMTDTDTKVAMLMYSLGIVKQKINVSLGANYTKMVNQNYTNQLAGGTLGISSSLLKDKLTLNWNNAYMINKLNGDSGIIFNTSLNSNYRFLPRHSVTLNWNLIKNSFADSSVVPSYNEIRGDLGYAFTF
ncbi:MAG: hypothetical protein RBT38_12215 [Bacteroidales bacterium]|jgi:hypothetical protein|nr:hypothetical protein [Bacteroidales bacterium]